MRGQPIGRGERPLALLAAQVDGRDGRGDSQIGQPSRVRTPPSLAFPLLCSTPLLSRVTFPSLIGSRSGDVFVAQHDPGASALFVLSQKVLPLVVKKIFRSAEQQVALGALVRVNDQHLLPCLLPQVGVLNIGEEVESRDAVLEPDRLSREKRREELGFANGRRRRAVRDGLGGAELEAEHSGSGAGQALAA